ncbi:MAG TPA: glycosyltransferase [Acidobacteriaceae bacterium]|nr:glycosyltransferase [Acidobacteriaceae bacterium]
MDLAGGGPPEGLRRLAEGYQREGHEVEIATLDDPRAPFIATLPYPVWAHGPVRGYGYSRSLLPWLREHSSRFDAVIVNGLWQYHSRAAWLALRGRQRYGVFVHGMLDPYFNRPLLTKFAKKWPYWFLSERHLIADAHRVFFTSQAEQSLAARSLRPYRANGMVVPYGTPGPSGDPAAFRERFNGMYPGLRGKRFLLFLGRIHPKKGCDLLIEGFAAAAASETGLHLVMAGPDRTGWKAQLEARARELKITDRIHWLDMLSGEAKWGAFYAADAFILPSHQENFGIAVAEALACGAPVLISDKINIFDEVQRDGAALVESDTLEGTRALLQRWIAMEPEQRTRMRQAARRSFESRFNSQMLPSTIVSAFQ